MDIVDRLFELVDEMFAEQKDFAVALGIDRTLPSQWRNRKSASYRKYLSQIAEVLGTTTEYLLTGEGPKKKAVAHIGTTAITDDDIKAAFFHGADPDMTPEEMDAMWEDARAYIAFKMQQRRQKQ